jgi:4-hydroxybenzoate polyprenyltransferase
MLLLNKSYLNLRSLLFGLVKYRLHLSLVYFLLLYGNNLKLQVPINYLLLVSFSLWHFSLFLFDRIYDRAIDQLSQPDEYVKDHLAKGLYGLVALMLLVSFICFWLAQKPLFYWFCLLPLTFLYPLHLYKSYRIKGVFLVKNLYSALLIFVVPVFIHHLLLTTQAPDLASFISLGIYVLIGEIFWDIRDCSADRANHTATLPNTLGIRTTKIILLLLMFIDFWVKGYELTSSAYVYLILLAFIREDSDRLLFHIPPLLALVNFLL